MQGPKRAWGGGFRLHLLPQTPPTQEGHSQSKPETAALVCGGACSGEPPHVSDVICPSLLCSIPPAVFLRKELTSASGPLPGPTTLPHGTQVTS